jgi:two-component system sensor histidine kinase CpxA
LTQSPLFLKVFVWFGLTLLAMVMALVVTSQIFDPEIVGLRWKPVLEGGLLDPYGAGAAKAYETEGQAGLRRYLKRTVLNQEVHFYLFDASGKELTGLPLRDWVRELAEDPNVGEDMQVKVSLGRTMAVSTVKGSNGALYRVVLDIPRHTGSLTPVFGKGWLWGAVTALLVLAGVCYWIARKFTMPVVEVCDAARSLASGDLSARVVNPKLLQRRDEFSQLAQDFNAMASRIESLVSAKQRLFWDISHELRSPLTRLSLALGMARRKANPEVVPAMDRIERETEQLNALIEQLLTLARITGGTSPSLTEQIELASLVKSIADDAAFEAGGTNRSVRLEVKGTATITGASELLRSAIENVVRNAVKFTAEATAVSILVEPQGAGKAIVIHVRDHGPGVPESELDRLFEVFYRVPETRASTAGSGLGLAITNQAVLAHGGWVKARNAEGGGLEVQIGLPVNTPAE